VHLESLAEAEAAARVLLHRLPTLTLPYTLPLLGGRMRAWLAGAADLVDELGGGGDPAESGEGLPPSVRCALEAAALSALAAARGAPLAEALLGGGGLRLQHVHTIPARRPATIAADGTSVGQQGGDGSGGDGGGPACSEPAVAVKGLGAAAGAAAFAAEAAALAAAGFTTLKIKARACSLRTWRRGERGQEGLCQRSTSVLICQSQLPPVLSKGARLRGPAFARCSSWLGGQCTPSA